MSTAVLKRPSTSNAVLGLVLFMAAECMFFGGLISAFIVAKANLMSWPPAGQPRLPVEQTALNTFVFLLSAATMVMLLRTRARQWLIATLVLGSGFLAMQGYEWVKLLQFGLTTTSSIYGAFFYLIIGAHAAHVLAGLVVLALLLTRFNRSSPILPAAVYWFYVVGLWPILYFLVYLN